MNKKALLALLLVMTLLLSSCSLVAKNQKKDDARAVLSMNGEVVITKAEANNWLPYLAEQMAYTQMQMMYQYYGYASNVSADSMMDSAKENLPEFLKQVAAVRAQAAANGVALTAEEEADAVASVGKAGKNAKSLQQAAVFQKLYNKLMDTVTADVVVTDEEIDEAVAQEKSANESMPGYYGYARQQGMTVYYTPAGYRMARNLLIKYTDEDSDKISSLNNKVSAQTSAMTTAKTAIDAVEGADLDALLAKVTVTVNKTEDSYEAVAVSTFEATEDEATKTLNENVEKYAKAQELKTAYQADLDAAIAAGKAAVQEKVDAVMARLEAGEDFVAVMNETTEDTGMASNPDGYPICAGDVFMDSAFVDAAMAIETVGQYGQPAWGTYGCYIAQYASAVEEGVDTENLQASLLSSKKSETFSAKVDEWVAAAEWTVNTKPLDD